LKIEVFWVVVPCSDVVGYQGLEGHAASSSGSKSEDLNLEVTLKLKYSI
jgi:hypothetical protein